MKPIDLVYLKMAEEISSMSKAKRKKVGAILVTNHGVILSGYNGTPSGTDNACEESKPSTIHKGFDLVTKPEVIHAELNCILKAAKEGVSVVKSTLYVTLSPCLPCAAMIKQAGIKEVFFREQYRDDSGVLYLRNNGVIVQQI